MEVKYIAIHVKLTENTLASLKNYCRLDIALRNYIQNIYMYSKITNRMAVIEVYKYPSIHPSVNFTSHQKLTKGWHDSLQRDIQYSIFLSLRINSSWSCYFTIFLDRGIYKYILIIEIILVSDLQVFTHLSCQVVTFKISVNPMDMGPRVRCYT